MQLAHTILRAVGKGRAVAFRLRHPSASFGRSFAFRGSLTVRGPGRVTVGDHVMFDNATGHDNRLLTFTGSARLSIGNDCYVNGAEIACRDEVTIGDRCILAECLIMDTEFHSVTADRHDRTAAVRTAPVRLGRNVWLANKVIVLRGVTIGENSVVGAGSVVTRDVPPDVVVAGNPARIVKQLINADRTVTGSIRP